jgi:imidazolonepropionase-like amidohydrolase
VRALTLRGYAVVVASLVTAAVLFSQPPKDATLFEGARFVIGDEREPIQNGAMLVQDGRIAAIGPQGSVSAPPSAVRVSLAGKTVIPTLNNVHIHIGYEGYTSWSAENHTRENVLDHLQREAFYGTGAVMTMGDQPSDWAGAFRRDQEAGRLSPAARFLFAAGMAPPGGGPDVILIKGTTPLNAVSEVSTEAEARAAVTGIAAKKIDQIKIWVDDRDAQRGSRQAMSPAVYTAVVEEAHKHGILVHAHATSLANQKAVVRAGIDVLVHTITGTHIDDEFMALLKERKPYWAPVMGLTDRSDLCDDADGFAVQDLPAQAIADIRAGRNGFNLPGCDAPATTAAAQRQENLAFNFPRMIAAGARLLLSTDAGVIPKYSFGSAEHHEMEMYVKLGLTPAQVIVASTSRPTEVLRLSDTGLLTPGRRADFVVLNANPLENIRNTRQIDSVFLNGQKLDRQQLLAGWKARDGRAPATVR